MDDDKAQESQEASEQDPVHQLMIVANDLAALANADGQDADEVKRQIAQAAMSLNAATKKLIAEHQQMRRQLSQQGMPDADSYEHERRRIEPRKPTNDPHRVDWKRRMGF
jgi:hypothetical protein